MNESIHAAGDAPVDISADAPGNAPGSAPDARPSVLVTTAIPYVNAEPHVGFAFELVVADVLARLARARGADVRFQTGSDENSLKNVRAAEAAGEPVRDFVARHAAAFERLREPLDLSLDAFVRTSADPLHRVGVERLWRACAARGDLYQRDYSGLYCVGCERFYAPHELVTGRCPEHAAALEHVSERNWFFRLSRYGDALRELIASGSIEVVPDGRRNEVLAQIDRGLEDISVSRTRERARGWGIPVPGDPGQVVYVWFDALANYVTAPGFGVDDPGYARYWARAASRVHVIGKGITRFHAIYWPAILLSAGLPLPDRLLVHGYLTASGEKISKSACNAVDPVAAAHLLGTDALRYHLLRHVPTTGDGDFSLEALRRTYDVELADQLGNLVQRIAGLVERFRDGVLPPWPGAPWPDAQGASALGDAAGSLGTRVERAVDAFRLDRALAEIAGVVALANRRIAETRPWALARSDAPGARRALDAVLHDLVETVRIVAATLSPFVPSTATRIRERLGAPGSLQSWAQETRWGATLAGSRIRVAEPLFPKPSSRPPRIRGKGERSCDR